MQVYQRWLATHTRTERNKNREPNYNKPYLGTVAILAQGTHRGDALCAALFLLDVPLGYLHRGIPDIWT